ncbi:protein TonB [Sphingomonas sp. YR710]|uniref:energy transducer TonB n=1 Tax=Sphingomonas sp. YR710 TaxID=1882773 RepID=UPI0008923DE1|nr:energy transducer TonB [Sphingomonas sp. YR710]SDC75856.1 protein TonB [Sphingomonas sp. YR710]
MEHEGFLDTRKPHTLTLGLIIAGHVAVLAAIILAPAQQYVRITWLPTPLIPIHEPPPPPESKPQHEHRAQKALPARPFDQPVKVDPILPPKGPDPVDVDARPRTAGNGATDTVIAPKLDPVTRPATIDPSASGRFQPDYPPSLVRAEIEGTATVRILIGTDGQVKQVELVSATNPAFFDATRKQALRYWRFRPATTDGMPTESWRVMTVKFHLES